MARFRLKRGDMILLAVLAAIFAVLLGIALWKGNPWS